jgi:hypothetical protein
MSEDAVSESLTVDLELDGRVAEWVGREASARDTEPEALLDELLRAHATVDGEAPDGVASPADVASLREDLAAVDQEVDELITDVRERVVQVKREADAKAPADHDHPEIEEALGVAEAATDEVEELGDRLDRGFENYEEVLTDLTDEVEDLNEKATRLARAVVNVREQAHALAEHQKSCQAADELAVAANRKGVTEADCETCGESVAVGLLAEPVCPHCAATFTDIEEQSGLFGSATLVTGDRPALAADEEPDDEYDLEGLIESGSRDQPSPTAGADQQDGRGPADRDHPEGAD